VSIAKGFLKCHRKVIGGSEIYGANAEDLISALIRTVQPIMPNGVVKSTFRATIEIEPALDDEALMITLRSDDK
jgi:hypothetical protein